MTIDLHKFFHYEVRGCMPRTQHPLRITNGSPFYSMGGQINLKRPGMSRLFVTLHNEGGNKTVQSEVGNDTQLKTEFNMEKIINKKLICNQYENYPNEKKIKTL